MSLRVWLPLNGNTNNQGLTNTTFSSGSITYTTGNLGQCMSSGIVIFNVDDNLVTDLSNTNTYTICAWVKKVSTSSSGWVFYMGSGSATQARGMWEPDTATTGSYIHWSYSASGTNINTLATYTKTEWNHVCFVVNGSSTSLYLNGVLQSTNTGCKTTSVTTNQVYLNATLYNICDFRLYDTCLSVKEIRSLSKGLILHYKLDSPYETNLSNAYSSYRTGHPGYTAGSYTFTTKQDDDGTYYTNVKMSYTNTDGADHWPNFTFPACSFTAGSRYWYCIKYRVNSASTSGFFRRARFSNDWEKTFVNIDSSDVGKGWQEGSASLVLNSTDTRAGSTLTVSPRIEFYTAALSTSGTTYTLDFDMKEPGFIQSASTTYPGYVCSELMGNVCDCSGYGNDGIPFNLSTLSSGVALNDRCGLFNGSSTYINAGKGGKVTDKISVSWWGYMDDWTSGNYRPISCTEVGGWNWQHITSGDTTFQFIVYAGGAYRLSNSAGTLSAGWHHFVGVWDGYKAVQYVDGVNKGTASTAFTTKTAITYNSGNSVLIGAEAATSSVPDSSGPCYFNGRIQDVRIYGTALNDEDVRELYQVKGNIDKSGNWSTNKFIEYSSCTPGITKAAIGKCVGCSEYTVITEKEIGDQWIFKNIGNSGELQDYNNVLTCLIPVSGWQYAKLENCDSSSTMLVAAATDDACTTYSKSFIGSTAAGATSSQVTIGSVKYVRVLQYDLPTTLKSFKLYLYKGTTDNNANISKDGYINGNTVNEF